MTIPRQEQGPRRRIFRCCRDACFWAGMAAGFVLLAVDVASPQDVNAVAAKKPVENYLGVVTTPVPAPLAVQLGKLLDSGPGLLVQQVLPSSPASRCGMKQYDVLTHFSGEVLTSPQQLKRLIGRTRLGQTVSLRLIRTAATQEVECRIEERAIGTAETAAVRNGGLAVGRSVQDSGSPAPRTAPAEPVAAPIPSGDAGNFRNIAIFIDTVNGREFRVRTYAESSNGRTIENHINGRDEDLRRQLSELPDELQQRLNTSLDRFQNLPQTKRWLQLKLQPRVEPEGTVYKLSIHRSDEHGNAQAFEIEQRFDGNAAVDVDELLDNKQVAEELRRIPPEIRRRIEEAVRQYGTGLSGTPPTADSQ